MAGLSMILGSSCASFSYFAQAGAGQWALFNHARPIPEVLKDERVPPRVRALLEHVEPVKHFGERMGLKATSNYQDYVQLDRPYVVTVVSACETLSFKTKTWSFPIVGSFPYLGWFDSKQAKQYAAELEREGWDVDVRGARAYSTLGWFKDAVLSSMLPDGEEAMGELVDVILHESLHASIYIKGQSRFNESLASFVAEKMAPLYLAEKLGPDSREAKAYEEGNREGERREKRLHEVYQELDGLYRSSASREEKLARKSKLLESLREELHWKRSLNNATLVQFKTYGSGKEAFEQVFLKCGSDWRRFLTALSRINGESFSQPQQERLEPVLEPLLKSGC